MSERRIKTSWKSVLTAVFSFVLVFSVISPANADVSTGQGGGGGTSSGSSSWNYAYGDRPGDAWGAFTGTNPSTGRPNLASGVSWDAGANVIYDSHHRVISNVSYSTCYNAAEIWWVTFNKYGTFDGLGPQYFIGGNTPDWWVANFHSTASRGSVPAGTVLSDGYTTPVVDDYANWVWKRTQSYLQSNPTANGNMTVIVCSQLSPANVINQSGTQTIQVQNGKSYNLPTTFSTVVQRQVLNTTSATANDGGIDLIGSNNLHDQPATTVTTNYGAIANAIAAGTLFGSTPMNSLSNAQWSQLDTLITNAQTQDQTLNHSLTTLDSANQQGLAEGGVLNVSEWAARQTITTSGVQTYTNNWAYSGVQYWNGSQWGPVQNIQWSSPQLTTVPTWNNPNGWTLSSQQYGVTNTTATQVNTGFWQIMSVHCNLQQLNAMKAALVAAGRPTTTISQTNNDDGTISAVLRTVTSNSSYTSAGVSNVAQQAALTSAQATLASAQTANSNATTAYNAALAARNTAATTYASALAAYNAANSATYDVGNLYDTLSNANAAYTTATNSLVSAYNSEYIAASALNYITALPANAAANMPVYSKMSLRLGAPAISNPVLDSSGNLYTIGVNSYIYVITPAGVVSKTNIQATPSSVLAMDTTNNILYYTSGTSIKAIGVGSTSFSTTITLGFTARSIALNNLGNTIYATNAAGGPLSKITVSSGAVTTLASSSFSTDATVTVAQNGAGSPQVASNASATAGSVYTVDPSSGNTTKWMDLTGSSIAFVLSGPNNSIYATNSSGMIYNMTSGSSPTVASTGETLSSSKLGGLGFAIGSDGTIYSNAGEYTMKYSVVRQIPQTVLSTFTSALTNFNTMYSNMQTASSNNSLSTFIFESLTTGSQAQMNSAVTAILNYGTYSSDNTMVALATQFLNAQNAYGTAYTNYTNAYAAVTAAQTAFNNSQTAYNNQQVYAANLQFNADRANALASAQRVMNDAAAATSTPSTDVAYTNQSNITLTNPTISNVIAQRAFGYLFYVSQGAGGATGGYIYRKNIATGAETRGASIGAQTRLYSDPGSSYLYWMDGTTIRYISSGNFQGAVSTLTAVPNGSSPFVFDGTSQTAYTIDTGGKLSSYNGATSTWTTLLPTSIFTLNSKMSFIFGVLYIASGNNLYSVSKTTGSYTQIGTSPVSFNSSELTATLPSNTTTPNFFQSTTSGALALNNDNGPVGTFRAVPGETINTSNTALGWISAFNDNSAMYSVANSTTIYANSLNSYTGQIPATFQSGLATDMQSYLNWYQSIKDANGRETNYPANFPSSSLVNANAYINWMQRANLTNSQSYNDLAFSFLTNNATLQQDWATLNQAQQTYNNNVAQVSVYQTAMTTASNVLNTANNNVVAASALVSSTANAVTAAQAAVTSAQAALTALQGSTVKVYSGARPAYLDFGDATNPVPALAASGYVGFYDKECVTNCTANPTGAGATAANDATSNASITSNLIGKSSLGGAVLNDSTVREAGTNLDTNSNYFEIFRDNSTSRTIRVNSSYPNTAGTSLSYDGSAPLSTTVNLWAGSTPDVDPNGGIFSMTALGITNRSGCAATTEKLFTGQVCGSGPVSTSRTPATQKNFGANPYSESFTNDGEQTAYSETFSGFSDKFQVAANWASDANQPVILNIKWEYEPTTSVTIPSSLGFGTILAQLGDDQSQSAMGPTTDITQKIDVRCYAVFGQYNSVDNNLAALTAQYTGTGTTDVLDQWLIGNLANGSAPTTNGAQEPGGDSAYTNPNNLVLKFVRGTSE